jgi:hypothetical protein
MCQPSIQLHASMGFDCDLCGLTRGHFDLCDPPKKRRAETARRQEVKNFGTELNTSG